MTAHIAAQAVLITDPTIVVKKAKRHQVYYKILKRAAETKKRPGVEIYPMSYTDATHGVFVYIWGEAESEERWQYYHFPKMPRPAFRTQVAKIRDLLTQPPSERDAQKLVTQDT